MRTILSFLVLLLALVSGAFAQENAGRVLVAVGDVAIERAAARLPAQPGTAVLAGDIIHLGSRSNAQIRFTDDSIVALGSETSFRVAEYVFQGAEPDSQRVFFNLIRGGMRTVTGLIGRSNKANYRLGTTQITLGIRGTAYAACQDCTGVDGQVLSGTTVGFTEGSGSISTLAGELLLTAGESAYASDINAAPVRIPSFPQTIQQASARRNAATAVAQAAPAESAVAAPASGAPPAASGEGLGMSVTPAVAALAAPLFQATSSPNAAVVLASSFSGTAFYRLVGPFSIPTTCSSGPCATAVAGEFVIGVNYSLQRAVASAAMKFSDGGIMNLSVPISLSGIPISISGNQVTFGGTFKLSDFPFNGGSFSCSDCGSNNTSARVQQFTVSGTINGEQATVQFSGAETDGSVTAVLPQVTPPNNAVATMASPALTGGDARSAAYWNVTLDAQGRLLRIGPEVGEVQGSVGGAANNIAGTAPLAGNLVWGTWVNGTTAQTKATFTDRDYATFQPANNSIQAWITGEAANSLPPSLGFLSFSMLGSVMNNPNSHLNSANLTADFVNRALTLNINATAATTTAGTNVYQMNSTTGFSPVTGRFSAGFNNVTCNGPCNNGAGTPSGSFGGFFSGSRAEGAGVAFTAGFGGIAAASGAGNGVNGVIAFGR
jgi:hypothetical protein